MCGRKFILVIAVVISACETIPEDQLTSSSASSVSSIVADSASVLVSSNAEALARVNVAPLTPSVRVKTEIALTDAAMLFDGYYSNTYFSNVHGNFKLFSFASKVTAQYRIALRSLPGERVADGWAISGVCFLYPQAYVMNPEGLIVNDAPVSLDFVESTWAKPLTPLHLLGIWEGEIGQGEILYFLVAADNRHPGSPISGYSTQGIHRSCWTGPISVELSLDESR
jgi:hypothetical protein